MGVYDSILVPCPGCDLEQEFQSKSGPCILDVYKLEDAPVDVLEDVNRHSPYLCLGCGAEFYVAEGTRHAVRVP